MANVLPRFSFYAALALSSLVALMLLSAAANFGFGEVIVAGPLAGVIVAVMLLNPVIFGILGFTKRSPLWHLLAAAAMLTLLLLYTLFVFGYLGPVLA